MRLEFERSMTARILVVDDVAANARLLEARLGQEYYDVRTAGCGGDALSEAGAWQPDLVLLDVMMPDMDGYEVCRRIKAGRATRHIPVVMVTALHDADERIAGLEAGADDFLTKPVDFETLLARVKSLVRLKRLLDEWRNRSAPMRGDEDEFAPPSVAGARALVVDDDEADAQLIQDVLARDGIVAGRAGSEAEAAALTAGVPLDLVVLSLSMTVDDPLRFASRLRSSEATQDIPLLLIADPEQKERILRGFDLGANDWVTRPVDANELRARARNQIRRRVYQERLRNDMGHAIELALIDPLTGLYNQRYLMRDLTARLASGRDTALALVMIDVDHFKAVNDRWGHPVGDRALRQVADALRTRVRLADSVARYGGEEFAVVMPGASLPEAQAAAERLRVAVETMNFLPDGATTYPITISLGVATRARGGSAEQLIAAADKALYAAKRGGRNRAETAAAVDAG
jgi:two-component system cell cycle response regulator